MVCHAESRKQPRVSKENLLTLLCNILYATSEWFSYQIYAKLEEMYPVVVHAWVSLIHGYIWDVEAVFNWSDFYQRATEAALPFHSPCFDQLLAGQNNG